MALCSKLYKLSGLSLYIFFRFEGTRGDKNQIFCTTERAEELFVYSKDLIENLEAIDKSDIGDKEKTEIEDKLEG
jgi:hypothetical protein